jgi:hypothetical protein
VHTRPPVVGANLSDKTQIGKNYLKIKEFFKMDDPPICEEAYVLTADQKSQFREQCINGDTLSFTVLSENGKEDTIIAATQYKRSDVGAWVNYFATSAKCVKKAVYGVRGVFLPEEQTFRSIGLGFTLLRTIQLLQCVSGYTPTLYVQASKESYLAKFLQKVGFKSVVSSDSSASDVSLGVASVHYKLFRTQCQPHQSSGYVWRENMLVFAHRSSFGVVLADGNARYLTHSVITTP